MFVTEARPTAQSTYRMPVQVDTARAPQRLVLTVTDPWPAIDEFSSLRQSLIKSGHLNELSRALIDMRHANPPNYHDANAIVAAAIKDGAWPLSRAYLVGSAVQFGFARQLQSLAPRQMEVQIFTSEDEALRWLNR